MGTFVGSGVQRFVGSMCRLRRKAVCVAEVERTGLRKSWSMQGVAYTLALVSSHAAHTDGRLRQRGTTAEPAK